LIIEEQERQKKDPFCLLVTQAVTVVVSLLFLVSAFNRCQLALFSFSVVAKCMSFKRSVFAVKKEE